MQRRTLLRTARGTLAGVTTFLTGCLTNRSSTGPPFSANDTATESRRNPSCFESGTFENPVFEPILADPTIVRADSGRFYVYGTADDWHDSEGKRAIPIIRSRDLVTWEYVGDVFDEVPEWLSGADTVWAPDIVKWEDEYRLYYSLVDKDEFPTGRGIGVATATDPSGPFEDHGEVLRSETIGVEDSIDPAVVLEDETPYLFWGSRVDGIYVVRLSADGTTPIGAKSQVAGDRFEGAYPIKRNGAYYLFVSSGSCCDGVNSTYQVEVARASELTGEYRNEYGRSIVNSHGRLVVDHSAAFAGPGHCAVIPDDGGTDWLVYHAYDTENEVFIDGTPRRALMLDPLVWEDGWPRVPDTFPSSCQQKPVIDS